MQIGSIKYCFFQAFQQVAFSVLNFFTIQYFENTKENEVNSWESFVPMYFDKIILNYP